MAKLSNITPGIAVVKEKIKSTAVLRVGINAMGLCVVGTDDESLKADVIQALTPAKGLFLNNPRAICEVSVIDDSFSAIYRIEKRFCITDSIYISPQQISAVCGLPYTPAQRVMLTPKMVLDIQQIMIGQSNVNICEYMKFTSNALSVSGTPVYGLTINNVFIKDRRSTSMTRIPDDQWSMSDTYKDIVWKSLISIAYNVIQQKPKATIDDICQIYIKTYGSSWITKLVVFNNKNNNIEIPGFMTAVASSNITSEQLVNAYQLMIAILRGKFTGVPHMDRDETVEYIKKLQQTVSDKINNTDDVLGAPADLKQPALTKDTAGTKDDKKEDDKKEVKKEEEPKEDESSEEDTKDDKKEDDKKEDKKEDKNEDKKEPEEEAEEADGEETGEEEADEEETGEENTEEE